MTAPASTRYPVRPAMLPAYGQQTAAAVMAIIEEFPELHDQEDWERVHGRGYKTTRCVAGWVQWLHTGHVYPDGSDLHPSADEFAQQALCLDGHDAHKLFYDTTDDQARAALSQLTQGATSIDWALVPERDDDDDDHDDWED